MEHVSILLVEDDPITTILTKKVITACNADTELVCTKNGQEALDYLSAQNAGTLILPDIILLDLNMPVLDGWGFLDNFRKHINTYTKKVALYICTSSTAPRDIMKAREYQFVKDFITKPLNQQKITDMLRVL